VMGTENRRASKSQQVRGNRGRRATALGAADGTNEGEVIPTQEVHMNVPATSLAPELDGLLAGLGMAPAGTLSQVEQLLAEHRAATGVCAQVHSMRSGRLVLSVSDPASASLLRFDADRLLEQVQSHCPGVIHSLRIVVQP
jgi:hypothetical protein